MARQKKITYTYAIGRDREASARIRIHKGKGENMVNDKPADSYFSGQVNKVLFARPFMLTKTEGKYYVTAKVGGGGKKSQLDAVILGISRALTKAKAEFRAPLKQAGLLTRDGRVKERRKVGMGGKARRKKQSPKR